MGIVFPDGTQDHPTSVIQTVQNRYNTIENYSSGSSTFQDIFNTNITARSNLSKLLVYFEVHGYNGSSGMDRSFGAQYKINSGSYVFFGGNTNTYSGMNSSYQHNNRGDDHIYGYASHFEFLLDNNWSDGDVVNVQMLTIGENTYYLNQGSQTAVGSGRFGRGSTRMILQEVI